MQRATRSFVPPFVFSWEFLSATLGRLLGPESSSQSCPESHPCSVFYSFLNSFFINSSTVKLQLREHAGKEHGKMIDTGVEAELNRVRHDRQAEDSTRRAWPASFLAETTVFADRPFQVQAQMVVSVARFRPG